MRNVNRLLAAMLLIVVAFAGEASAARVRQSCRRRLAQEKGCLSCHEGIERFSDGDMQETIEAIGADSW